MRSRKTLVSSESRLSQFSIKPLLTTEDVASILRINVRTVQRLVRARRLPVCTGAGKHWRFEEDALREYIRDTTVLASRPKALRAA